MEIEKEIISKVVNELWAWFAVDELDDNLADILAEVEKEMRKRIHREYKEAAEQASWETRYYHERDYGGRL